MKKISTIIKNINAREKRAERHEEKQIIQNFKKRVISTLKNNDARQKAACWDDPNSIYFEFLPTERRWIFSIEKKLKKEKIKYELLYYKGIYISLK